MYIHYKALSFGKNFRIKNLSFSFLLIKLDKKMKRSLSERFYQSLMNKKETKNKSTHLFLIASVFVNFRMSVRTRSGR